MLEQDGDYLQMDHIDYEMYSAVEPLSSTSSLEDEGRAVHLDTMRRPVVEAAVAVADSGGEEEVGGESKCSVDDVTVQLCLK